MKPIVLASLLFSTVAFAQDTRTVTEPQIPLACVTLKAMLNASGNQLAEADETRLDTLRIQQAIDGCKPGQAVELAATPETNAFLSGPLELKTGVTLLVDKGVTLYGSRNPKDYEKSPDSCGLVNDQPPGCRPLINAKQASGAGIMGDGTIDGRGGAKLLVNNSPFSKTWWNLADEARAGGRQQVPRLIEMDHSDNFTLYRITLKNSANFHVTYHHGDGFTVWGLKIDTPQRARNTDGVDPSASKNITVTNSFIRTGDDNIAIKGGDGPVTNMTVIHNHFGYGHGMSIGSETVAGVSKIRVIDLSLDGPDSGIRIKSNPTRGGLVQDVVYEDVCIRNSKSPIDLRTDYSFPGKDPGHLPSYLNITLRNVRVSGGGSVYFDGFDSTHRIGVRLDNVLLTDGSARYKLSAKHADITLGPGPVNFQMAGEDSTQAGKPSNGTPADCAAKFAVPFPSNELSR